MHYFLKPLVRAMHHMNDRDLVASIILGFLLFTAGPLNQCQNSNPVQARPSTGLGRTHFGIASSLLLPPELDGTC
jgi:hypothetical protein